MKQRIKNFSQRLKDTHNRLSDFNEVQPPVVSLSAEHEESFTVPANGQKHILITSTETEPIFAEQNWDLFFLPSGVTEPEAQYKYPEGVSLPVSPNNFHVQWWWDIDDISTSTDVLSIRFVFINQDSSSHDLKLFIKFATLTTEPVEFA